MVPSTLRSGTAPVGSVPISRTSTVRVPLRTAGSMRDTLPGIIPLRVSISASCPMRMSLAWVSAIFSSAFSLQGCVGQRRAGGYSLSILHQEFRDNAINTGADLERLHLPLLQLEHGAQLVDL